MFQQRVLGSVLSLVRYANQQIEPEEMLISVDYRLRLLAIRRDHIMDRAEEFPKQALSFIAERDRWYEELQDP